MNFLSIQGGGSSQKELLGLFDQVLQKVCGLPSGQCGVADGPFVYLDDVVYTGNRIRIDLTNWVPSAPAAVDLHVITMGLHSSGVRYASQKIEEASSQAGSKIKMTWWRVLVIEQEPQVEATKLLRVVADGDSRGSRYPGVCREVELQTRATRGF